MVPRLRCDGGIISLKVLYTSPPGRPVHSDTNSASLGSIIAMQKLRAMTNHSHFQHCLQPGTHLYNWVDWGIMERPKMPKLQNVRKEDSNPGCLDCESGILPLTYQWGGWFLVYVLVITFYWVTLQIQASFGHDHWKSIFHLLRPPPRYQFLWKIKNVQSCMICRVLPS